MNCNTTHYRANSSSVPGDPTPRDYYQRIPAVRRVMDSLRSGLFAPSEPNLFDWIYHSLVEGEDKYFHLADLESYLAAQERVDQTFLEPANWDRMAILNVARIGRFSSDRTISEYARDIWGIQPTH